MTANVFHHHEGSHYVVSEDVDLMIGRFCNAKGLLAPKSDFYIQSRSELKDVFSKTFAKTTFVPSFQIRESLLSKISEYKANGLRIVSLERAYLEDGEIDGRIEISRKVNSFGDSILVPSNRFGSLNKNTQYESFRNQNIVLVDDVIFSGSTLLEIIGELTKHHCNVHAVISAIGIKDGIEKVANTHFGIIGMPERIIVDCVEEFDDLIDQVCERDFYAGVPYSGREHAGADNVGFPYFLPFGNPKDWASIPDKHQKAFSKTCLAISISLFEEIERLNDIEFKCKDLPRFVNGIPKDNSRYVEHLKQCFKKL